MPSEGSAATKAADKRGEDMKPSGQITATLLVATLAAVGCSKSDETSQPKASSEYSAKATPVSMTNESSVAGDKGLNVTPKITGPVSFADGETAYKVGKFGEATQIFELYTVQKPENAWGHFMLGLSASKSGDPAKAEKAFDEALRIDPNHVKSLVNLSRVL